MIFIVRGPAAAPASVIVAKVANGPTSPDVPMPAPRALFVIWSHTVDTGPSMAEVSVGASHIIGFLAMLPI